MKKYVIKATALAIGALVGGNAFAAVAHAVDFDAATPTVSKYAKELPYSDALPMTNAAGDLNIRSKIGFGVSNGQTRYIRVDYANATLDAVHAAVGGTDIEINNHGAADTYAVVQGGAVGDSYVIYQVTAATDHAATEALDVLIPALRVTSTASAVTVTYSLHETAVSAVAGASGAAKLYSKSQNIATFGSGLSMAMTTYTTTASVEKAFKEFVTTGTLGSGKGVNATTARIGKVTYAAAAGVLDRDGTAIALADLVAAGTKIVATGDFSVVAGADDAAKKTNVFLDNNDDCGSSTVAANAFGTGYVSADFVIDTNAATKNVCYVVTGTGSIASGSYTAGLTVVKAASTNTENIAAAALGSIDRDGTELQAPFATIHADYLSRVVLTSTHSVDSAVDATVIAEDGVTCPTVNGAYTLKAGKQLIINTKDICPALSAGTRLAVKLTIAAPTGKVSGVYNVMNYNQTTGATDSLISYPLLRPGTN